MEGNMQLARLSRFAIPLAVMSLGPIAPAVAQSYPSEMIRIVAGAAGTPSDIIVRIVANELGRSEGWRIIVENKPGPMSVVSAPEVLKQPADGHTILAIALPSLLRPALLSHASFRLDTDFTPVIKLITSHQHRK